MQVRGSSGSPALHTGGQVARASARVFALRPFGLSAPSALAARRLPAGSSGTATTQHACTWRSIHAAGARRSQATGSSFGMNSRASQRADELAGADPANRAPLAHPRQLAGRSWPRVRRRGARFGDGLETDHLNGRPGGREATRCAVRPLRGAEGTTHLATLRRPPYVSTPRFGHPPILYSASGASAPCRTSSCQPASLARLTLSRSDSRWIVAGPELIETLLLYVTFVTRRDV